MKIMKTILVDDEPMALEVLKHMLSPYKEIEILATYSNRTDLLKDLKNIKPEIIFLDIEMGQVNGLELAEIVMGKLENVEIIFVTAYSQYAVDAFEINAIDYLLKPVQEKRLEKAIKRLKERNRAKEIYNENVKGLKVYSFGGFQVLDGKGEILNWRTKKAKELFAYLWTRMERTSSKDLIIEAIFPDRELDKASTLLHTTVYQLRKALDKLGYSNAIIYSEEGYRLDLAIESDLKDLEIIIEEARYNEDDIRGVLEIYKGDFLEEGYHWAIETQQMYKQLVFNIIESFVKKEIKKEKLDLIVKLLLDKLYEIDPFNNSAVEMMIKYYGIKNEIAKLEIFFDDHKEKLWQEMGLEPTKKIIQTYKEYI